MTAYPFRHVNGRGLPILIRREAVRTTYYDFQSEKDPTLHAFTDDPTGAKLLEQDGSWTLVRPIAEEERSSFPATRAIVRAGVLENGFFLWGPTNQPTSSKRVIESDRVEGTAVYDPEGNHIGTIKRLQIEKVSGRVEYVDITFGGFLGLGTHHYTVPWEKLSYDTSLGGYRTDITEEQVKGAPTLWEDQDWLNPKREKEAQVYWGSNWPPHWRPPV